MVAVADYSVHSVMEALENNRLDEAFELCSAGIEGSVDAQRWFMFGHIHRLRGNSDSSLAAFEKSVRLMPDWLDAVFEYACALQEVGRFEESLPLLEQVVAEASSLAIVCRKYAFTLKSLGRFEEALGMYEAALQIDGDVAEIWSDLGSTYLAWNRPHAAIEAFRVAVRLEPGHATLWYNLGSAALMNENTTVALDAFRQALEINPAYADAHLNLGVTYRKLGQLEHSISSFRRALSLRPEHVMTKWNLSTVLLMNGESHEGWAMYESRRELSSFSMHSYSIPAWKGESCPSGSLLVHAEQGFGDTFQFVRFLGLAGERVGRVVLAVQKPLKPLFESMGIADEVITHHDPVHGVNFHVPLMSLPYVLGLWQSALGEGGPYLRSTEALVEHWRHELSDVGGFRVGIGWQGNPSYKEDRLRSVPLTHFEPLMRRNEVSVVSLQKFHGLDQLEALGSDCRVLNLGCRLDETSGAFMDTAAVLANLDLVITSDTALAHLAGAVGVPVWVVLGHVPDWRWGLRGERCEWYPNMRLFRQPTPGDWGTVMRNVNQSITEIIGE